MTFILHMTPGQYGSPVKAGPIFDAAGQFQLLALRAVDVGDTDATRAFLRPDFSRPEVGEADTWAAEFWHGKVPFYQ